MKMIKEIDKLIRIKVLEIVFLVAFVMVSTSLWKSSSTEELFSMVSSFGNLSYTSIQIENPIQYEMFPMRNQDALKNVKPCVVLVSNDTYTEEEYMLVLKIDKSSTLDYHVLNISMGGEVFSLKDLPLLEETLNYYFVLDENKLKGDKRRYEIQLWMDASAGNEMQSKSLAMNFELMNSITKM